MPEFVSPDFISGNSAEEIQSRMMNSLPAGIDDMPGGFPYDFTMPTALEKSELIQFHLVRTLMLMFPMWAWDEWLDYHAETIGITRRSATCAECDLMITGTPGTQIPAGSGFATQAKDNESSIVFYTSDSAEIALDGTVKVHVVCSTPGRKGNVAAGTIILMLKKITGIDSLTNEFAATGGVDRESDESLRERIQEANEADMASFVGNNSDYIRWAKEVPGVGSVNVIPLAHGNGTVELVISSDNGEPADEELLKNVYDYIISPNEPLNRKAPIGATLSVVAPETMVINYTANIALKGGYAKETVIADFKDRLRNCYEEAQIEGILRYTRLAGILSATDGVKDFETFSVNGSEENIMVGEARYLKTGTVEFVEISMMEV